MSTHDQTGMEIFQWSVFLPPSHCGPGRHLSALINSIAETIGSRCNRKTFGLKGTNAAKDHVAEMAIITQANPPRSPKASLYLHKRTDAMPEAINNLHFQKTAYRGNSIHLQERDGSGTNSDRSSGGGAGTTKAMSIMKRSLQLLR